MTFYVFSDKAFQQCHGNVSFPISVTREDLDLEASLFEDLVQDGLRSGLFDPMDLTSINLDTIREACPRDLRDFVSMNPVGSVVAAKLSPHVTTFSRFCFRFIFEGDFSSEGFPCEVNITYFQTRKQCVSV